VNSKNERIKKLNISPDTTLKTAMRALNAGDARVLFVMDNEQRLIGCVTDGDVRRGILNAIGFERPVSEIMFKFPRFVRQFEKDFKEKARQYVLDEKLYTIPVLDSSDRIVDVLFWHEFIDKHPLEPKEVKQITNPIVIMAGGKGERLNPFTRILPKPLIPFGDKPIIEKIMDNFAKHGFRNFILTLNYKKEFIKMYLKESKLPYNIEVVEEEKFLGSAGSLVFLKDKVKETFFVCNCDTFLINNFRNILLWHKGEQALLTLIGCHKETILPYGVLRVDNGCLNSIEEKPKFDMIINTGVYLIEPEVLSLIKPGEYIDMNRLVERVLKKGKVTVFPVVDGWSDIGQWKEYNESLHLLQNGIER